MQKYFNTQIHLTHKHIRCDEPAKSIARRSSMNFRMPAMKPRMFQVSLFIFSLSLVLKNGQFTSKLSIKKKISTLRALIMEKKLFFHQSFLRYSILLEYLKIIIMSASLKITQTINIVLSMCTLLIVSPSTLRSQIIFTLIRMKNENRRRLDDICEISEEIEKDLLFHHEQTN